MHIMIIGAAGMLGSRLARHLTASTNEAVIGTTRLTLVDMVEPVPPREKCIETECLALDLTRPDAASKLAHIKPDVVFHLAAVVSGEAEANFEKGYQVNFHATLGLLEAFRSIQHKPRVVFSSSLAVYGPPLPDLVAEDFHLTPASSYGAQKAMAEFLVTDYTRKGFIDGVSLRLPTIVVRPGKPNAAASGFLSGIIREPLAGLSANLPVALETRVRLASPDAAVGAFIHAAQLSRDELGDISVMNLPGLSITIGEMLDALESLAGPDVVSRITRNADPAAARIVKSWPSELVTETADKLGFQRDADFHTIIRQHMKDVANESHG